MRDTRPAPLSQEAWPARPPRQRQPLTTPEITVRVCLHLLPFLVASLMGLRPLGTPSILLVSLAGPAVFLLARWLLEDMPLQFLIERQDMPMSTVFHCIPLGVFAIGAVRDVNELQYMVITLLYVMVSAAWAVLRSEGVRLHNACAMLPLYSVTLGWLFSSYTTRVTMPLALSAVGGGIHLVSRHLRQKAAGQQRREQQALDLAAGLQEKLASLQQRNRLRAEVLASASHDLRQNIQASGLLIESLLRNSPKLDWRHRLEMLQRSHTTTSEMLSGLLEQSSLESGARRTPLSPTSLNDILKDTQAQFFVPAQLKGLRLSIAPTALYVHSDPHLLRRVVFNLVSNAIKFTRHGEVSISVEHADNRVELRVFDTGIGIAPEQQHRIYDAFTQLDQRAEGSGLGLAIVRQACAQMNHTLTLVSHPSTGSTFTVSMERAWATPLVIPTALTPPSSTMATLLPCRGWVALIDDDPVIRKAAGDLIRQWGFAVTEASDSRSLLELIHEHRHPISLLISDLHLSGEDGLSAIRTVRTRLQQDVLPAIVFTGDTSSEFQRLADAHHVNLLHKPASPAVLRGAIEKFCTA